MVSMHNDHRLPARLDNVPTPLYLADELRLQRNLRLLKDVKDRSGTQILYAIKGCPFYHIFPQIAELLDGSTASGPYEARLGFEHFVRAGKNKGEKEIHVFCPAYSDEDIVELLALGTPVHFYFNSVPQLERYEPAIRRADHAHAIGIRINPRYSVTSYEKYDPCRKGSHLGVPLENCDTVPWDKVDILHTHALCENMAEQSAGLIEKIAKEAAPFVERVAAVNFGGGHFITHPDYDRDILVKALNAFKTRFPGVRTILEPGGAVVRDAGYIVATVIGIVEADGVKSAVLDASANCHCPDVVKAGVRLEVLGAEEEGKKPHDYTLVARTCMASDRWGTYSFDAPLAAGDQIAFRDGLQYSMGEANWFNGHKRPSLAIMRAEGDIDVVRSYGYKDFERNCG
jgi:carboxynorspermidine decarboxylase